MNKAYLLSPVLSLLFLQFLISQDLYDPNQDPYQIEAYGEFHQADFEAVLKTSKEGIRKVCIEKRAGDTLCMGCYFTKIGMAYEGMAEYRSALEFYNRGLDCYLQTVGELHGLTAHAYLYIGKIHYQLGHFKKAKSHLWKALGLSSQYWGWDHWETTKVYFEMGKCLLKMGDYANALISLKRSLYYETTLNRGGYRAETYDYFCEYILETGEVPAYLNYARKKIEAQVGTASPEDPAALFFAKKALTLWQGLYGNAHPRTAIALKNVGRCYIQLGEYERAKVPLFQSLEILQQHLGESHPLTAGVYETLGTCFQKKGEIETALQWQRKALETRKLKLGEHHPDLARSYLLTGTCQLDLGHFNQAEIFFNKALATLGYADLRDFDFEKTDALPILLAVLKAKIRLNQQWFAHKNDLEKLVEAQQNCRTAIRLVEHMRVHFFTEDSKRLLTKLNLPLFETSLEINWQLHSLTGDPAHLEAAFEQVEKSKGIVLLDALRNSSVLAAFDIPENLRARENELKNNLTRYRYSIFREEQHGDSAAWQKISYWNWLIALDKQQLDELWEKFEAAHPDFHHQKNEVAAISVRKVRSEMLGEEQALVEYFVGERSIFVFVISKKDFFVKKITLDFPLKTWAGRMLHGIYGYHLAPEKSPGLQRATLDDYRSAAHFLYQKIWEPVAGQLPRKVIIIPDSELGYLPFEALLSGPPGDLEDFGQYPYLIWQYQFSYGHSAALLYELHQKTPPENRGKLLAVAPCFEATGSAPGNLDDVRKNLGPLLFNTREIEAVMRLFGGTAIREDEATKSNILAKMGGHGILHFATHGKANEDQGEFSFLAFARPPGLPEETEVGKLTLNLETGRHYFQHNQRLHACELYNRQLDAGMVVLSACETGIGELKRGEGVISLARAFTYAGARSVVTTLWSINDQATAGQISDFYENLKKGKSKDAALRNAKLAYLERSDNANAHPFFWAAFVATGDMRPLDFGGKNNWIFWVLGGVVLTGVFLWSYTRFLNHR